MEKNKNRVFKLLGLLVVVFLVCLCMLGSTFARYTTGGTGTATAEVAEWDVTALGTAKSTNVTIGKLSPMLYSNSTDSSYYSANNNSSQGIKYVNLVYKKVAQIKITNIEVDAQLQMSYGNITVKGTGNDGAILNSGSDYSSWSADGISTNGLTNDATWDQVSNVLEFHVGYEIYTDSSSSFSAWSLSSDDSNYGYYTSNATLNDVSSSGTSASVISATSTTTYCDIYAWVTWTSDYYSATDEDVVDAIDTWIGKNVASISATVTCKLVQASTVTSQNSN